MHLPAAKQMILTVITEKLQKIENVVAIVLGGSYANGQATENSDLDIGIYYYEDRPFRIEEIRAVAEEFNTGDHLTVTEFYEWGPWVNGGAWLDTAGGKVDFLYKNIDQVQHTIEQAANGEWQTHFEQQPPYGFVSTIYQAETHHCIPLYDPQHVVAELKNAIWPYPRVLKESMIQRSLWSAEFTIMHANGFAKKGDVYNTIGCLTRAVKNIVDSLAACNEVYLMGDKRAIEILLACRLIPTDFTRRINNILCAAPSTLIRNVDLLRQLFSEVVELTGGIYRPAYSIDKS